MRHLEAAPGAAIPVVIHEWNWSIHRSEGEPCATMPNPWPPRP